MTHDRQTVRARTRIFANHLVQTHTGAAAGTRRAQAVFWTCCRRRRRRPSRSRRSCRSRPRRWR